MGAWTRGMHAFCSVRSTGWKPRIPDWSVVLASIPRRGRTVRSPTLTRVVPARAGGAFEGAPVGGAHVPLDDGRDVRRGCARGPSVLRTPRDAPGVAVRQSAASVGSPGDAVGERIRPQRRGTGPLRAP